MMEAMNVIYRDTSGKPGMKLHLFKLQYLRIMARKKHYYSLPEDEPAFIKRLQSDSSVLSYVSKNKSQSVNKKS